MEKALVEKLISGKFGEKEKKVSLLYFFLIFEKYSQHGRVSERHMEIPC